MLMGLRCCLYTGKHKVILETEFGDAVREWEGWRNFIDPTHAELIRSLVHRTDDERLKLEICVVKQSRNQLARYLAEDGAVNRTMPKLPVQFCSKYSEVLYESMELKLRNGYILRVQLDLVKGEVKGFLWFFKDMELSGGELLLFEYFGRFSFNVYIIGDNGAEISYPDRVHCLQLCLPSVVSVGDGGWRFFSTRVSGESILDEIDAPAEFIERCGLFLPERITYVLSNGKKFDGSYNSQNSRFSGLSKMSNIVGVDTMYVVRNLLLTYDVFKTISISAFDSERNEAVFPGTPLCMDASGSYPLLNNYFQITVEKKHMSDDCFAVEISNEYNDLSIEWDNFQYLNIFTGLFSWRILVRKRDDHQCPTIEDGWKILRDGLALKVGNVCIFECPTLSYDQFRIRVLEGDNEM
ncbi:hypothetical protein ACET3Z_013265 [Daucus carota]